MKKTNPKAGSSPDTVNIHLPEGFRESDELEAVLLVDDTLSKAEMLRDDIVIVLLTSDIEGGDYVAYRDGDDTYVGLYHPAPAGRLRLETVDEEPESIVYKVGEITIVGRVLHAEREGKVTLRFRPVRTDLARVTGEGDPTRRRLTERGVPRGGTPIDRMKWPTVIYPFGEGGAR